MYVVYNSLRPLEVYAELEYNNVLAPDKTAKAVLSSGDETATSATGMKPPTGRY